MRFDISTLTEVDRFILTQLPEHPHDIAKYTAERFGITRQAVSRYLRKLVAVGLLTATGETRKREYGFAILATDHIWLPIDGDLQEDRVWTERVAPLLAGTPENVVDICRYGVTEMVNNAIDHSSAANLGVVVEYTAPRINLMVTDQGIGIFRKIKEACGLEDERHAIFELSKGKLTTDPVHHTGEGIFFTSRMFDNFGILSGVLWVGCRRGGDDWLIEDREHPSPGTSVHMKISPFSEHTMQEVFDRYATDQDDFAFSRTHIVVALAQQCQAGEKLVSRSQARRVISRLDRFRDVVLDFKGVAEIGPAFADEVFRVFVREHPATQVRPFNTSDAVTRMIHRAMTAHPEAPPRPETPSEDEARREQDERQLEF